MWGSISRIETSAADDAAKAWDIASRRIAEMTTASRRIDRRTSRDEGIPRGFPYLTGFVSHFAIL